MGKLIGISTGLKNVDMAPGNIPCVVINSDFVKACNKYGNTAVICGPHENSETIDVSIFDALVISGGGDINPNIYGEEKLEKTLRSSDHRDSTELAMLKSAEEHNIKTLAICRGHQLLNVYKGGSLYQDLGFSWDEQTIRETYSTFTLEENIRYVKENLLNDKIYPCYRIVNVNRKIIHHASILLNEKK